MDIITVVISAVALLVAIPSVIYTRHVARIEGARRHDERVPDVAVSLEHKPMGPNDSLGNAENHGYKLWLTMKSEEPLTGLRVQILNPRQLSFTPGVDGAAPGGPTTSVDCSEMLGPGDRTGWQLDNAGRRAGSLELRITCARGDEQWVVLREAKAPPTLLVA